MIPALQVRSVAVMPKHFKASDERHIAQYWRNREVIRRQWHRGFTRTLGKRFSKELKTVKGAIDGDDIDVIGEQVRAALAAGRKDWTRLYKGLYVGVAGDIAPMVWEQYGDAVKARKAADPWNAYILEWLDANMGGKIDGLLDTTWTEIHDQVLAGMDNQESMEDIFKRLDSLYGDRFSTTRSMTIARTEVTAASNIATQKTGEFARDKYELDIRKRWITARDASVRDSHTAMEGVEIGLDELFSVNGSMMLCPGDTSHGADLAEVINCRCDCAQHVAGT